MAVYYIFSEAYLGQLCTHIDFTPFWGPQEGGYGGWVGALVDAPPPFVGVRPMGVWVGSEKMVGGRGGSSFTHTQPLPGR